MGAQPPKDSTTTSLGRVYRSFSVQRSASGVRRPAFAFPPPSFGVPSSAVSPRPPAPPSSNRSRPPASRRPRIPHSPVPPRPPVQPHLPDQPVQLLVDVVPLPHAHERQEVLAAPLAQLAVGQVP